ncbi:speedy protein 1-A-like [Eleutherodactylus coqui]|uniref:speedy protein 1-A-like n=1 Tax=Eleutherodactylus coqui TaxID=57060 RepID=UPI003462DFEB
MPIFSKRQGKIRKWTGISVANNWKQKPEGTYTRPVLTGQDGLKTLLATQQYKGKNRKELNYQQITDGTPSRRNNRGHPSRKRKRKLCPCEEDLQKRRRDDRAQLQEEREAFFRVLELDYFKTFLTRDSCMRTSDKYLLAMVLVYFRRAGLRTEEYRINFFRALFLANQMEEDIDFCEEIYAWALGDDWRKRKDLFLEQRNQLFRRLGFNVFVDRSTCERVMAEDPTHWAWTRQRQVQHSWAIPMFRRHHQEFTIHGPWGSPPPPCALCKNIHRFPPMWRDQQEEEEPDTDPNSSGNR